MWLTIIAVLLFIIVFYKQISDIENWIEKDDIDFEYPPYYKKVYIKRTKDGDYEVISAAYYPDNKWLDTYKNVINDSEVIAWKTR